MRVRGLRAAESIMSVWLRYGNRDQPILSLSTVSLILYLFQYRFVFHDLVLSGIKYGGYWFDGNFSDFDVLETQDVYLATSPPNQVVSVPEP